MSFVDTLTCYSQPSDFGALWGMMQKGFAKTENCGGKSWCVAPWSITCAGQKHACIITRAKFKKTSTNGFAKSYGKGSASNVLSLWSVLFQPHLCIEQWSHTLISVVFYSISPCWKKLWAKKLTTKCSSLAWRAGSVSSKTPTCRPQPGSCVMSRETMIIGHLQTNTFTE